MARVAFVTCEQYPELTPDDRIAAEALARAGVAVVPVIWNQPCDWRSFELIVFRSMWDYHLVPDRFEAWLQSLAEAGVAVLNPIALGRWNLDKSYLRVLEARGVAIVPTTWHARGSQPDLAGLMDAQGWSELVVKPMVSSTAFRTWRVARSAAAAEQMAVHALLADRAALLQEYQPEIEREGEWSLVYIGGALSHTVIKRAAQDDFRVQVEHGGSTAARVAPPALVAAANRAIATLEHDWLYARVDGVNTAAGFRLMEFELLEPGLFFENDERAAIRFAEAVCTRLAHLKGTK